MRINLQNSVGLYERPAIATTPLQNDTCHAVICNLLFPVLSCTGKCFMGTELYRQRTNHGRRQGRYTVRHYNSALQRDPLICLHSAEFASGRRSELLSFTEGVAYLKMPEVLRVCMKRRELKVHYWNNETLDDSSKGRRCLKEHEWGQAESSQDSRMYNHV